MEKENSSKISLLESELSKCKRENERYKTIFEIQQKEREAIFSNMGDYEKILSSKAFRLVVFIREAYRKVFKVKKK